MECPITAEAHTPAAAADWDRFIDSSRNGCFLHRRGYLDYHADRFPDASVVFKKPNGAWLAALPAHLREDTLVSHGGLPFAGLIASPLLSHRDTREIFAALARWMEERALRRLQYTPVPAAWHDRHFEDDLFVLHSLGARCRTMKLSAGFQSPPLPPLSAKARELLARAGRREPCDFAEAPDDAAFWTELEGFLQQRHGTLPVHTMGEILLLKSRFPGNIRFFRASRDGVTLGGAVVYFTPRVARTQYLFRNLAHEEAMPSARLILWLAGHPEWRRPWMDLGTSMSGEEVDGHLLQSKERTGARGTLVQTWIWEP